jgi:hypothetical protein
MKLCNNCTQPTANPKYCSRSCAASVNNHLSPKRIRKPPKLCIKCNQSMRSKKMELCPPCGREEYENKTLQELCLDKKVIHRRSLYNSVRSHARAKLMRTDTPKECHVCSYSLHVQVCHRKPISSFDPTTTLRVINDLSNLVYLCGTHHWEVDHDLRTL